MHGRLRRSVIPFRFPVDTVVSGPTYIVDTRMPWGTRWLLGGGNRKRARLDVGDAASLESDFFTHAEAEFALWNMHVRERDVSQATEVARRLARDFPENRELAAFLAASEASARR